MRSALVITGVGAITALGPTATETWERILRGDRAFSPITVFPADDYRVRLVAEVPGLPATGGSEHSRTSELALRAAREALTSAALDPKTKRVGVVVGGSTAGMSKTESTLAVLISPAGEVDEVAREEALRKILTHPLSAPTDRIVHELGPFVRIRSLSSACSSGANAMLVGATWLELGLCDAVLCGAADALCRVTLSGFNALAATDPDGARPFDRRRRGLTLGEGAGFVVLERAADAAARKKDAICTLLGWAARSEAHHITNPEPNGVAPAEAMTAALARAGLRAADVDYVNAHGTGTPLNDPMEANALVRVFGDDLARVPVSSQKGQIGHTLAAAGAIEAVVSAIAIARGVVPPTGGLEEPDPACPLVHPKGAEERPLRAVVSSSFGFGGMDAVLVLGRRDLEPKPRKLDERRVVVTGASVITPEGVFGSDPGVSFAAVLATPSAPDAAIADAIEFDLAPHLDLDRARRLDRGSRLAAIVVERALGSAGEARDAGVVLGNAFGSVDGTAYYMRRLREKGARMASPAEFPSLVPSSPAGHVSIYLGLGGPSFVVADLGCSGEAAFVQGVELVRAGEADRMAVGAVEEKSVIVDQVFRVVFGPARNLPALFVPPPRREGAGAVAIAEEGVARARGLPVLAVVARAISFANDDHACLAELPSPPPSGAIVVLGGRSAAVDALIDGSPWAKVTRVNVAERSGSHEAAGGIALAVASAILGGARGNGPRAALCIGSARGWGHAIVLVRPEDSAGA